MMLPILDEGFFIFSSEEQKLRCFWLTEKHSVQSFQFLKYNPYYFSTRLTWVFGLQLVPQFWRPFQFCPVSTEFKRNNFSVPCVHDYNFFCEVPAGCCLIYCFGFWRWTLGFPMSVWSLPALISWPFCSQVQSAATLENQRSSTSALHTLCKWPAFMGRWILGSWKIINTKRNTLNSHNIFQSFLSESLCQMLLLQTKVK